ncbi:uncharacterized protein [Palaemon carinicauda]|uniref:uncharacterized protein n=1 Tax=Palaemon carinicauda TaxID=392227 RepID=UPI0035B5A518
MRGRVVKAPESESDWDSMSETERSPQTADQGKTSRGSSEGHAAAVPRKLKSLTLVDPASGKGGEKPPFDFKSEAPADNKEDVPSKPGKSRKGNIYDPKDAKQRRVSFAEGPASSRSNTSRGSSEINGNKTGGDSDSEDPLYAVVNHKLPKLNEELPTESLTRGERRKKTLTEENTGKLLQGMDNKGYIDDEETSPPIRKPSKLSILRNKQNKQAELAGHQGGSQGIQESANILPENEFVLTQVNAGMENIEGLRPLILSLGQSSIESAGKKPIYAMNKAISEACMFLSFPVFFLSLLLHHFIRFLLQGLVKPLIVDSLVLLVEYLISPCVSLVIKPMFFSLNGASSALSDFVLVCLKPVTAILRSFRLVEINYTRKYSIEDV